MDAPVCPNFKRGTCERSDPVILEQSGDAEHYQFGCRTCRCGYVVTAPIGVAHAKWSNQMKANEKLKFTERDKALFLAPTGGWDGRS